jgi:hypothetical protein
MPNIKFIFLGNEEIHDYSLGDLEISVDNQVLSSHGNSRNKMMVFISLVDFFYGIISLITDGTKKEYEFIGADSSFQFLITKSNSELSITSIQEKITMSTTADEMVQAMWQCWKDAEKYLPDIEHDSAVHQDMINGKKAFIKAFENKVVTS